MRIYGLDFTSAPTQRKPITWAACTLAGTRLHLHTCRSLPTLAEFDALLRSDGPWLATFDFPFGQPRALIDHLGWPSTWEGYMSVIAEMDKAAFQEALQGYMAGLPPGMKLRLRATDALAGARSPMMLYRVPVAKMFFAGATRLFHSRVSILPCRPALDSRVALEGYPALVARYLIGKRPYKSDVRERQSVEQETARREMVHGLRADALAGMYGLEIGMSDELAESLVKDAMGDRLDAVLCAVQAGWAYLERERGYGIPPDCDRDEGWIVDPLDLTPVRPQSPPASQSPPQL